MSAKKIIVVVSLILVGGYAVLAYTDWPTSVPALRYVALRFCGQSSGLYYVSYTPALSGLREVWRIDENYRTKRVNVRPELIDQVATSPDGRHLAYSIQEAESAREQLYVSCADGSRSFALTGWHRQLYFRWLNADLLIYDTGSYLEQGLPPKTDVLEYLLSVPTGEVKDKGNPFEYRSLEWNPRDPDLVAFFRWDGGGWFENSQTGKRTDVMPMRDEWGGGADGAWSPDGRRLAFRPTWPKGLSEWKQEVYLVDADGSNLRQVTDYRMNYPGLVPLEFTWSPDGQWLALLAHKRDDPSYRRLFVLSLGEGKLIDMGLDWDNARWPVWSPDSRQIAFTSHLIHQGHNDIYAISVATKEIRQLTDTPEDEGSLSWR